MSKFVLTTQIQLTAAMEKLPVNLTAPNRRS